MLAKGMTGQTSTKAGRASPRVVIVGGGTAGWMTAASLSENLGALGMDITLIESSRIGTVGVGEATVPAIRRYFQSLGLTAPDVMKATNGTVKLGIVFDGWAREGRRFCHSFGQYGFTAGPAAFHHLWWTLNKAGEPHPLDDYNLGTQLAYRNRFAPAADHPRVDFEIYDWAIHFDAGGFARFLKDYAIARGVRHIDADIVSVARDGQSGDITRLHLDGDRVQEGDFFVDCSGFRGLLIQGAMNAGYRDWRQWLLCDSAVAMPCLPADPLNIAPITRARARAAGWTWRIPLQHRIGNGYVYSSDHISHDDAEAFLRAELEGAAAIPANRLRFRPGVAEKSWVGNCVAIGLAGGFLEPLESTSITLIQAAIEKLIELWPPAPSDPRRAQEFNRFVTGVYERIRDFIILHYSANGRTGEPLWDHCRAMALPDTLQHRLDFFRASGALMRYDLESFFDASWVCMFEGFGVAPEQVSPWMARFDIGELKDVAAKLRADIAARAEAAPLHTDFLRLACGFNQPA